MLSAIADPEMRLCHELLDMIDREFINNQNCDLWKFYQNALKTFRKQTDALKKTVKDKLPSLKKLNSRSVIDDNFDKNQSEILSRTLERHALRADEIQTLTPQSPIIDQAFSPSQKKLKRKNLSKKASSPSLTKNCVSNSPSSLVVLTPIKVPKRLAEGK